MAKKNRRTRRSTRGARAAEEFNPDYTEIKNDLKRIATLAGVFLAILIVLSFVL